MIRQIKGGGHSNWLNENKLVIILIIAAIIICSVKFFPVSDGRFFIIGDDPIRHLSVINSFIEHRGIVYPMDVQGFASYVYYAPLFHIVIAVLSILTGIAPMVIQNLTPLFFLLMFFIISYKLLKIIFDNKETALFLATILLIFFPIPTPNPHYAVYFILIPFSFYLIFKIFAEEIFNKKKMIYFLLLFATVLTIGLTHSQSMAFYFATMSFSLLLGIFIFDNAKDFRTLLLIWLTSAIAYATAFFLFSFVTPTFWEAIIHFFSLVLFEGPIFDSIYGIYLSTGPNKPLVIGFLFVAPLIIFAVLYFIAPLITETKNRAKEKIRDFFDNLNLPDKAKFIKYVPFAIIFISLIYILFWNIIFTIIQFVFAYLFSPSLPFFALIKAMNSIYGIAFFGRSGFEGLVYPYAIGLVLLFIAATYAIVKLFREKEFSKYPQMVILLAFMVPLYLELILLPFVNLSKFVNPLILDRFYYYNYAALIILSAPVILRIFDYFQEKYWKSKKWILPYIVVGAILICVTIGATLSASYDVNPVQNAGYVWLTNNTPITANNPELNFDILGYYHISDFPKQYVISIFGNNLVAIDLIKKESSYDAQVSFPAFGFKKGFSPGISFDEHTIGKNDIKIYENSEISFYYEGS